MVAAGTLDRRLIIRKAAFTRDAATNEEIPTWATLRQVWGTKIAKGESETIEAGALGANRVVTFRVRYMADVTERDRINCEGLEYDIRGIREVGRREGLELTCEARQ